MIDVLEINGKRYDFLFDMEMVWYMNSSGKIDVKNEGGEVKLICGYNDILELFLIANKAAIEYQNKGNELDLVTLKNGIRKEAKLFIDLQNLMAKSEVLTILNQLGENGKKKSPGKKSLN